MNLQRNQLMQAILSLDLLCVLVALGSLVAKKRPIRFGASKTQPGSIAVVHIYGAIHTSEAASAWSGTDADDIAQRLHDLSEDDDVKAILLRINSPGGTVGAVQEINTEIYRCKA